MEDEDVGGLPPGTSITLGSPTTIFYRLVSEPPLF